MKYGTLESIIHDCRFPAKVIIKLSLLHCSEDRINFLFCEKTFVYLVVIKYIIINQLLITIIYFSIFKLTYCYFIKFIDSANNYLINTDKNKLS